MLQPWKDCAGTSNARGGLAWTKRDAAHYSRKLTEPEERVLFTLLQGRKNRAIAQETGLSVESVKHYLMNVYDKLGASNRIEAIHMALAQGVFNQMYGYWGA